MINFEKIIILLIFQIISNIIYYTLLIQIYIYILNQISFMKVTYYHYYYYYDFSNNNDNIIHMYYKKKDFIFDCFSYFKINILIIHI